MIQNYFCDYDVSFGLVLVANQFSVQKEHRQFPILIGYVLPIAANSLFLVVLRAAKLEYSKKRMGSNLTGFVSPTDRYLLFNLSPKRLFESN